MLPIVSGICCVLLMSNLAVETWLRFLIWLVLGLIIYVAYGRTHARLADPARFDALVQEERDVTADPARLSGTPDRARAESVPTRATTRAVSVRTIALPGTRVATTLPTR